MRQAPPADRNGDEAGEEIAFFRAPGTFSRRRRYVAGA